MRYEDQITGERGIPWAEAAEFLIELKRPVPQPPPMSKAAALGQLKLARLRKLAETPEELEAAQKKAVMTDPNIVEALDHEQAMTEYGALTQTIQDLQDQVTQAQEQAAQADQAAQQAGAQAQQSQVMLEQSQAERDMAMQQAVAAKDQAMAEQITQQQNRQQLMQAADQLALQLKEVAAQPTMTEQQQQLAAQQAQDPNAAAAQEQVAAQEAQPSPSAEAEKEEEEAVNAQDEAQKQTAQAQEAKIKDEVKTQKPASAKAPEAAPQPAKVQVTMPKQGSAAYTKVPTRAALAFREARRKHRAERKAGREERQKALAGLGPMGKQGSDRVAELVALLKGECIEKEASPKIQAIYTAGGAVLGAGKAGLEQAIHRKKFGKDKPSNKEIDISAKLLAAQVKARRNPTYANKIRVSALRYKKDLARADRQSLGGAMTRGAIQGAVVGGLAGPAVHRMGGRALKALKAAKAGRAAARAAEKAVRS